MVVHHGGKGIFASYLPLHPNQVIYSQNFPLIVEYVVILEYGVKYALIRQVPYLNALNSIDQPTKTSLKIKFKKLLSNLNKLHTFITSKTKP